MIVINALTTTWKRIIDNVKQPMTVNTREPQPAPQVEELPSCYWVSHGDSLDQKSGFGDTCKPAPARSRGGSWTGKANPRQTRITGGALHPLCTGCHAEGPAPAKMVWGRLGLQEMLTPASTEHSRMSLQEAPSPGGRGFRVGRG